MGVMLLPHSDEQEVLQICSAFFPQHHHAEMFEQHFSWQETTCYLATMMEQNCEEYTAVTKVFLLVVLITRDQALFERGSQWLLKRVIIISFQGWRGGSEL